MNVLNHYKLAILFFQLLLVFVVISLVVDVKSNDVVVFVEHLTWVS